MLNTSEEQKLNENIHAVLAHSYVVYFVLFLLGLFFHLIFPIKISDNSSIVLLGLVLLFFSTFLIFWAQKTSRTLDNENLSKESFCRGPYCYVRMPTHLGLFLLMFGLGLLINSLFVILFALISFFVNKFFFIKKEETLLFNKYGLPYLEYKKSVKY